jgi:hypothetical protein
MHLFPLHVIASPKGVAISSISGLLRRFTPRNDKLLNAFVLIDVKTERGDEFSAHRPRLQTQNA